MGNASISSKNNASGSINCQTRPGSITVTANRSSAKEMTKGEVMQQTKPVERVLEKNKKGGSSSMSKYQDRFEEIFCEIASVLDGEVNWMSNNSESGRDKEDFVRYMEFIMGIGKAMQYGDELEKSIGKLARSTRSGGRRSTKVKHVGAPIRASRNTEVALLPD